MKASPTGVLVVVTATLLVAAPPALADSVRDGQWYLGTLDITRAQTLTRGQGVDIGIVDSGVDTSVAELSGTVAAGRDFSGRGGDGQRPVDKMSHGTNVASILVGRGNGTGNGVIGVAPAAELVSASIDVTSARADQQIAAALRWVVDKRVRVVSLSLGGSLDAATESAFRYAQAEDVVVVAAAGNTGGSQAEFSCVAPGVVCVGGIDKSLRRDPRANADSRLTTVGPFATDNDGGPRSGIPAAEPATSPTRYKAVAGTSFAAPVVAGIIALIRAKYPSMDAANVINRLIRTARPMGTSPNPLYGYGIPDAYRALTADVPAVTSNPLGTLVTKPSSSPAPPSTSAALPRDGGGSDGGSDGSNAGLIAGLAAAAVLVAGATASVLVRRRRRGHLTP